MILYPFARLATFLSTNVTFLFAPPQARFAQQQLLNEIARKEAEEKARREKEEEEERNRLRLEREHLEREAELKRLQEEVCGGV